MQKRVILVRCDVKDLNGKRCDGQAMISMSDPRYATIRQILRDAGWTVQGNKDFCPIHSPD